MDKLEKEMNVTLPAKRKSFSGEVTCELPGFDAYIVSIQEMCSQPFSSRHLEIKSLGDKYTSVVIRLTDPNPDCSQWLWKLACSISIAKDVQNLFKCSNNKRGLTIGNCLRNKVTEMNLHFSIDEFFTAAKAYGIGSTFRIVVQYEAIGYYQGAPQYNEKPKCPGGIRGKPELMEELHRGAESDFIIICKGQEYPVHRAVLKWGSPVFRRMLETPMVEASSNKLIVSDVDPKIAQMMIDFIYTARILVIQDDEAVNLLYCAEKYELVALKEHCLKNMKTIVSETNVTAFLPSAIKCNAAEVVKDLVDWCKKRFWKLYRKDKFRAYFEANLEVFYGGK